MYHEKRNSKTWDTHIKPMDLLAEAHDQRKLEAYHKVEGKTLDADTAFWDDYIGVQMMGAKTKQVANVQGSQLQNSTDRFEKLPESQLGENFQDNLKKMTKEDNFYKMTFASLQDADAMLFSIYHQTAQENREVTADEKEIIVKVNEAKKVILAELDSEKIVKAGLGVPDQHRKNIALKTLKMNDAMVGVMGGMNKDEARSYLKSIGYPDESIAKLEGKNPADVSNCSECGTSIPHPPYGKMVCPNCANK